MSRRRLDGSIDRERERLFEMTSQISIPESWPSVPFDAASLPPGGDRRSSPRRPFPYTQRMAICRDSRISAEDGFQFVRCNDISTMGISFFFPTEPNFSQCVIELEILGIYVLLDVVYSMEVPKENAWLVACQFRDRAASNVFA